MSLLVKVLRLKMAQKTFSMRVVKAPVNNSQTNSNTTRIKWSDWLIPLKEWFSINK